MTQENQLRDIMQSLAQSEARNASESQELTLMLQECRALPRSASPRLATPAIGPPMAPPSSPPMPMVPKDEHVKFMKAAESTISQLRAHCERAIKERRYLNDEVRRLTGLVDSPLREVRASSRDSSEIIDDVIHRLVTMGVFTPNNSAGLSGSTRAEQGGAGETGWTFADAAGSDRLVTPDDASSAGGNAADGSGKHRNWKRPVPVHVPKFPTVTQIPQWEKAVARALVASSIYDDKQEGRTIRGAGRCGR